MKAALFGAVCATILLLEVWANLNPLRSRFGLPELPSAAVYGEPRSIAKNQHPTNDQGDAEPDVPTAATNPGTNPTSHKPNDGKGLDWPAWIQAGSALATVATALLLVRISGQQATFAGEQVKLTEGQLKSTQTAAEAAVQSNNISREFFIVEQRPWVAVAAVANGSLTWNEHGANFSVLVTLTNVGKSPATEVFFEATTFLAGDEEPLIALNGYCGSVVLRRDKPSLYGMTIFPGKDEIVNFSLAVNRDYVKRFVLFGEDWFIPFIRGCVTYRASGFTDLKFTGMLYTVAEVKPEHPNAAFALRVCNGDLLPGKYGIGPYPGGSIAR